VLLLVYGSEMLIMLVFWYFLPNHLMIFTACCGVNFVVMSSYEMPCYHVRYLSALFMFYKKDLPDYRMCNCLFPIVIVVETHTYVLNN
jgi:hypothetical protein